ncbi:MAG TPA: tetratricopeptide repeat protein [Gammaproteobacteria bacterium]|nr:tetratricopeptide repeat protein [Gammaproteobacteria bacterium]
MTQAHDPWRQTRAQARWRDELVRCERALRDTPGVDALWRLARVRLGLGQYGEARLLLELALARDPARVEARFYLSVVSSLAPVPGRPEAVPLRAA